MTKVASEDSVRNGMKAMDEAASGIWMKAHLKATYEPLLQEPWILDNALSNLAPMEVQAGNQTNSSFAQPELWSFLDGLAQRDRPIFLRGDNQ